MRGHLFLLLLVSIVEIKSATPFDIILASHHLASVRLMFSFNGSMYTDWSDWGKCSPETECNQVRYRECIDKSYLDRGTGPLKRCNARFIVENRICEKEALDQCRQKIEKANKEVDKLLENCGIKEDISRKIFGGQPSESHKAWPWNVGLHVRIKGEDYSSLPICGGTLIAPGYILTAGHCLSDMRSKKNSRLRFTPNWMAITEIDSDIRMKAVINDYILSEHEGTEISSEVESFMIHPKYNLRSTSYDIAILKLKKPFKNDSVTTACLPRADVKLPLKTNCYAVGWGYINNSPKKTEDDEEDVSEDEYSFFLARILSLMEPLRYHRKQSDDEEEDRIRSDELLEVKLPLQKLEKCKNIFSDLNPKAHICAGQKGSDTCRGDSGGGLYCQDKSMNDKWVNYGITSYGSHKGCGLHPSIYTSVAGSREWIESVLRKDYLAMTSEENETEE